MTYVAEGMIAGYLHIPQLRHVVLSTQARTGDPAVDSHTPLHVMLLRLFIARSLVDARCSHPARAPREVTG